MVRTGPSLDHPPRPRGAVRTPVRLITGLGIGWLVVIAVVTTLLAIGDPPSMQSQLLSSLSVLSAITFGFVASIRAALENYAKTANPL